MGNFVDLTGKRFGKLTVLRLSKGRDKHGFLQWVCLCDCGNETLAPTSALNTGHRTSCGCNAPMLCTNNKRLYRVWRGMRSRCENPNVNNYHRYGGRGIKVCDEWHVFANFLEWAMSNGYDPDAPRGKCTLDRIDNDADYCPDNCRWSDMSSQCLNKRRTKRILLDGERLPLSEAAKKVGISMNTVDKRLRAGWSPEDSILIPPSRSANNKWVLAERLNRV